VGFCSVKGYEMYDPHTTPPFETDTLKTIYK